MQFCAVSAELPSSRFRFRLPPKIFALNLWPCRAGINLLKRHDAMTFAEFKKKWSRYQGKETSAYQSHFDDLCRLLGQPTPNEADPSGADFFCFQKRVVKDAELFQLETPDATGPEERGFADVWKKDCFAWEYKGKKNNLDEAYKQLLRYRESLLNPPHLTDEQILEKLLALNLERAAEEAKAAQVKKPKTSREKKADEMI